MQQIRRFWSELSVLSWLSWISGGRTKQTRSFTVTDTWQISTFEPNGASQSDRA